MNEFKRLEGCIEFDGNGRDLQLRARHNKRLSIEEEE